MRQIVKGLIIVMSVCLVQVAAQAQVRNGGFENWSVDPGTMLQYPDGWSFIGIPGFYVPINYSLTIHSGSFAVQGHVVSTSSLLITPILTSQTMYAAEPSGFPVSERHASLTGYYQFSPESGDGLHVIVAMYNNHIPIGTGSFTTTASVSSYTMFTADITYTSELVPNSCLITITICGPTGSDDYHEGSDFLLDDLDFSGTSDVADPNHQGVLPVDYSLEQNFPNPFNPSTTLRYYLPVQGFVSLKVYDLLGNDLATLVEAQQGPGNHTVDWNAGDLPSGLYIGRLIAGTHTKTIKLLLEK